MGNTEQPTLLDNWIGWLQARIPILKESHNVFWLKQAMGGYKSDSSKMEHTEKSEVKSLSAEEYWLSKLHFNQVHLTAKQWCALMESFASMRVEQSKKEWEAEKEEFRMSLPDTCPEEWGSSYYCKSGIKCKRCF